MLNKKSSYIKDTSQHQTVFCILGGMPREGASKQACCYLKVAVNTEDSGRKGRIQLRLFL
jgi:hypothetical protein